MQNMAPDAQPLPAAERAFLEPLAAVLWEARNPDNAMPMEKYMKGKFAFLGIQKQERTLLSKDYRQLPKNCQADIVLAWLWKQRWREFQYYGIGLLEREARKAPESTIELYERLITEKSWWDTVDALASNCVGPHLATHKHLIPAYISRWMKSGNIWLQRTCLLFQLKYKGNTDEELLLGCIRKLCYEKEFFIKKAIGWALREYSKTNPDWVVEVCKKEHLSSLSRKEALKWLQKKI
jgi:3-methyladenine DNA glycosylase AlkD